MRQNLQAVLVEGKEARSTFQTHITAMTSNTTGESRSKTKCGHPCQQTSVYIWSFVTLKEILMLQQTE